MNVESSKKYVKWEIKFIKNCKLPATCHLLHNFIRAMIPWPVSWTFVQLSEKQKAKDSKRLRILKAHIEEINKKSSVISHKLVLDEVQLEGKNPVSWEQFKAGYSEAKFI